MASNNAFLVLLLLAVVATTGQARIDLFGVFNVPKTGGMTECISCECKMVSDGNTMCYRTDRMVGRCPTNCGPLCPCLLLPTPVCFCTYEVMTCPDECPNGNTQAMFENLLALNRN